MVVVDTGEGTPRTDPLYDSSHPDECTKYPAGNQKKNNKFIRCIKNKGKKARTSVGKKIPEDVPTGRDDSGATILRPQNLLLVNFFLGTFSSPFPHTCNPGLY